MYRERSKDLQYFSYRVLVRLPARKRDYMFKYCENTEYDDEINAQIKLTFNVFP